MLRSLRYQRYAYGSLLHFNLPKQKPCPLLPLTFPSSLNSNFCTTTSESESESKSESFRVSYLINNVGFPREAAQKAAKQLRFKTSERPDSFFSFLRSHGFSDSNIRSMLRKEPWLLASCPHDAFLPKFEFFLSKGASASDIVRIVTTGPTILKRSLENCIVPLYELLKRFLKSDQEVILCMAHTSSKVTLANIKLMVDYGVCDSGIIRLLRSRQALCRFKTRDLLNMLEEVKGLGFDPSKCTFGVALLAMRGIGKTRWDEKVGVFKKWGWSDETILQAFRRQPNMMLASSDRINLVMDLWVNQMGWDSLALVRMPEIFSLNLQRRIIPRAAVLHFVINKGLLKKNPSLLVPFVVAEKVFLNRFVLCFKEESAYLSKLYEEKMNLASTKENPGKPSIKHAPP